jgi:carboxypeptidase C (cathepsin A)
VAFDNCDSQIVSPLSGTWDRFYILDQSTSNYPPDLTQWLNNQSAIGAEKNWSSSNNTIFNTFISTGSCDHNAYPPYTLTGLVLIGDWARSSIGALERVIEAGVRTVIYSGDADYYSNYQGVETLVNTLKYNDSSQYASTPWSTWTVDGVTAGQFRNAGNFSYVRIFRYACPI